VKISVNDMLSTLLAHENATEVARWSGMWRVKSKAYRNSDGMYLHIRDYFSSGALGGKYYRTISRAEVFDRNYRAFCAVKNLVLGIKSANVITSVITSSVLVLMLIQVSWDGDTTRIARIAVVMVCHIRYWHVKN
jgi:hypothetical protein